ncbi:MAG: hypothetical protein RLN81_12515 [Balneolaceae bacterium]
MSYAVRNTIILLVTLFIIIGLGAAYSQIYLKNKINDLENELSAKQSDLSSKQNINADYAELITTYEAALNVIENYDKVLYESNKPDNVFDFLNKINEFEGNKIFFDFVYSDSIPDNEYGILESSIVGFGSYGAVVDFINSIEHSQLLNKVSEVVISPPRAEDDINDVNFSFILESYYQKTAILDSVSTEFAILKDSEVSRFNPLYPLILPSVPNNTEGLVNVSSARIIGVTGSRVFLSEGGKVISLKVGDKVYLGYLESIDIQQKKATFNLNKGGIQEVVTLEVVR